MLGQIKRAVDYCAVLLSIYFRWENILCRQYWQYQIYTRVDLCITLRFFLWQPAHRLLLCYYFQFYIQVLQTDIIEFEVKDKFDRGRPVLRGFLGKLDVPVTEVLERLNCRWLCCYVRRLCFNIDELRSNVVFVKVCLLIKCWLL